MFSGKICHFSVYIFYFNKYRYAIVMITQCIVLNREFSVS